MSVHFEESIVWFVQMKFDIFVMIVDEWKDEDYCLSVVRVTMVVIYMTKRYFTEHS